MSLKITHWRDPQGKFAKKNRQKGNIRIVVVLIVIAVIGILGYKSNWMNIDSIDLKQSETVVEKNTSNSDLTAEQEANLKKQYELSIRETALKNKKEKRDTKYQSEKAALDAEYKADSDAIETELEAVRLEKTSFQ